MILGLLILILIIALFTSKDDNKSLEEFEQKLDISYKDRFNNKKESVFYHPTTGYKGTKSEMDAYITNREKKLKNE